MNTYTRAYAVFAAGLTTGLLALGAPANSLADPGHRHGLNLSRPDGHAPIGVMADHIHKKGELMLSYRFMHMGMHGNRSGSTRQGSADVLNDFVITPTRMDMQMHMLGAMYAVSDSVTLVGMAPVVAIDMDHITRAGAAFTTRASGVGDVRLGALVKIAERSGLLLHGGLSLSLPTGSIDERDNTPAGPDQKLPYPMQLGSGTYDLVPSLTYNGQSDLWSWGAQASAVIRTGDNDENYTLGDSGNLTFWGARRLGQRLSVSVRADAKSWGNIDGADPELPAPAAMVVPTADPGRRGGERVDLLLGLNAFGTAGLTAGHRLALEAGAPIAQHLDGPQLETDWIVTFGWQYAKPAG